MRVHKRGVAGALAVVIIGVLTAPALAQTPLLNPLTQPKFVNPLPTAARVDMTAGGYIEIEARLVQKHLGL